MPTLQVENLCFTFQAHVAAQRYDSWQHYTNVWSANNAGQKAVDVVALETSAATGAGAGAGIAWLIEAKDFRVITHPPKRSNIAGLAQTTATKVTHTRAGLAHAAANAAVASERIHAAGAMAADSQRVVLHLEPYAGTQHSALFPKNFSASVLQKLRQLVRAIDPNPMVLNIANTPAVGVPWTVA